MGGLEALLGNDRQGLHRPAAGARLAMPVEQPLKLPPAASAQQASVEPMVGRTSSPSMAEPIRAPLFQGRVASEAMAVERSPVRVSSQATASQPAPSGLGARARGPGQASVTPTASMSSAILSEAPMSPAASTISGRPVTTNLPVSQGASAPLPSVSLVDPAARVDVLTGSPPSLGDAVEHDPRTGARQERASVTLMEDRPGRRGRRHGRRSGGGARAVAKAAFQTLQGHNSSSQASAGAKVLHGGSQPVPEGSPDLLTLGRVAGEAGAVEQSEARVTSQAAVSSPELSDRRKRVRARGRGRVRLGRAAAQSTNAGAGSRGDASSSGTPATSAEGGTVQDGLADSERLAARQAMGAESELAATAGDQPTEFTTVSPDATVVAGEVRVGREAIDRAASRRLPQSHMPAQMGDAEAQELPLPRRLRLRVADPKGPWSVDVHDHGRSVDVVVRGDQSLSSVVNGAADDLRSELPQVGYSLGSMEFLLSDGDERRGESSRDDHATNRHAPAGSRSASSRGRGPIDPRVIRTI